MKMKKIWVFKLVGIKDKFEISAPTKLEAQVTFMHEYGWLAFERVKSVSLKR